MLMVWIGVLVWAGAGVGKSGRWVGTSLLVKLAAEMWGFRGKRALDGLDSVRPRVVPQLFCRCQYR